MGWSRIAGICAGIHHLQLPKLKFLSPHYHYIKKHFDLAQSSKAGFEAIRNACGHTIAHVDGGYTLILTILPACFTRPDPTLSNKKSFSDALGLLNKVTEGFRTILRNLPKSNKARPTISKQRTLDLSHFHVLSRNQEFILHLLDRALERLTSGSAHSRGLVTWTANTSVLQPSTITLSRQGRSQPPRM